MSEPPSFSTAKQQLLERMQRGEAMPRVPIEPAGQREPAVAAPLSPSQEQVWLHAELAPQVPLYNESVTLHFHGDLDRSALERAFSELVRRHEIWRTTFVTTDGAVTQRVHAASAILIPFTDLSELPQAGREAEANRMATAEARRLFDPSQGPLLRLNLFKLAADDYRLYIALHHLIFDGVTLHRVLLPELSAICDAYSRGLPSPLPEPSLQYGDYAVWQTRMLESDTAAAQRHYWRERLEMEWPSLQLPTDRPTPAFPSYHGDMERFSFPDGLSDAVARRSRAEGVTPYMLLLSAFKSLLFRYGGQQDLVVGAILDSRPRAEFERVAGFFCNTVLLRTRPSGTMPFRTYLAMVRETVLGALAHADIPVVRLLRDLQLKRHAGHLPLQVAFSIQPPATSGDPRWDLTQTDLHIGTTKFDLYLELEERAQGWVGRVLYSTDLFDASTIRRMITHWLTLLTTAVQHPDVALRDLPVLTSEEQHQITVQWNDTARPVPQVPLHRLVEDQARRRPDAIAVQDEGRSLDYRELNTRSNRLARRLRQMGVAPGDRIGISVDRSCDMVVAMLAVLKTGAAYLPIVPSLPTERVQFMREDATVTTILEDRDLAFLSERDDETTENLDVVVDPGAVAVVLYTSGSTGRPKGVQVIHSAMVNVMHHMQRELDFNATDTWLAITTLSFDLAGTEIFVPLITGGRVVIASRDVARDPVLLMEAITQSGCTFLQATPATWGALLDAGWRGSRSLRAVSGGEVLRRDLADRLLPRCAALWNMYGPTETTIYSTTHRVAPGGGSVSIGRPIANTQIYILDGIRQPLPIGAIGELYIGGAGLARGYLNRPELDAERFVAAPSVAAERLYCTGDRARWLPDGTIEYVGRADNQVKVRGFRVELEEVEAALAQYPDLGDAAVRTWPDASGNLALVAYVAGSVPPDLREFLAAKLPDYMIPAAVIAMESLPLTPSRKVDRKALPAPSSFDHDLSGATTPSDEVELRLVRLWESLLAARPIGVDQSFFDLGGHSLLVARLTQAIEREFGIRLPLSLVFQEPTVRGLALVLRGQSDAMHRPGIIPLQLSGSEPPVFWVHGGPLFAPLAARVGGQRPFIGVRLDPAGELELPDDCTLEDIAGRLVETIRSVQRRGPYHLGGWCNSGVLALETALQLRAAGQTVAVVIMLDSSNPVHDRAPSTKVDMLLTRIAFHTRKMASLPWKDVIRYGRQRMAGMLRGEAPPFEEYSVKVRQAVLRYVPKPYDGRVVVIQTAEMPVWVPPAEESWAGAPMRNLQFHTVPGTHRSVLDMPDVAHLGACVQACLAGTRWAPDSERLAPTQGMTALRLNQRAW